MLSENIITVVLFLISLIAFATAVRWLYPKLSGNEITSTFRNTDLKIAGSVAIEPGVKAHKIIVDDNVVLLVTNKNRNSSVTCVNISKQVDDSSNEQVIEVRNA